MSSSALDKLAIVAAQQKAMEEGEALSLPHGARLFDVEKGWASTVIRQDENVVVAETLLSLEAALQRADTKVIFIPSGSLLQDKDIEKLCQRNATIKTIFREVGTT